MMSALSVRAEADSDQPSRFSASKAARDMLKTPPASMSITVRKPLEESASAGTRKLPAAQFTSTSSRPE